MREDENKKTKWMLLFLTAVLSMALLLSSSLALAQEKSQGNQTTSVKQELSEPAPDLSEIIPLAAKLSSRLAALESKIKGKLNISEIEKKYAAIDAKLKDPAAELKRLKDSKTYKLNKLLELKEAIEQKNKLFEEINEFLSKTIRELNDWKKEWLAEKKRWSEWQSYLQKNKEFDQLKSTFKKTNNTIDTALNLILTELGAMLKLQVKASDIQAKINALATVLDLQVAKKKQRREKLFSASPPMFSPEYFSQFRSGFWYELKKGLNEVSWPGKRFFAQQGWIVLLQGFLSLVMIIAVYRNRLVLNESKRWRFLGARPFSAGLFLGFMATIVIYKYYEVLDTWRLANTIIGGISFARLLGGLVVASWKRHFVYGLIIVLIVTRLTDVLSLPDPLLRLYIVLTALVALVFCLRWAKKSVRHKGSGLYTWSLRLFSCFFVFIMVAEFWGKKGLASYLFVSLIDSIATVIVFMLFIYLIRGGLEWLFATSPFQRVAAPDGDNSIIGRVALFINTAIFVLVFLPDILVTWGFYDSLQGATKGLLALGFNMGSQRISLGLVVASAAILYGSFLLSWILQKLLMDEVLINKRVEKGVRFSIAKLIHYFLILTGFLLAISALGFELTKLTIILGALGVGIGFGLQGIVNNFVSGLILLFERPIRVGDTVELDGNWAVIKRIGLRSTTVHTFDDADVIIPNANLVNNAVTNWTLSNRRVRLIIPVGVAYGSDVPLVIKTLIACSRSNTKVVKNPEPQVLFLGFGNSSLDFELRVWIVDADFRLVVKSELHQEIDRSFREEKIEIAFPQQDLHLRSIDKSVNLRPPEKNK